MAGCCFAVVFAGSGFGEDFAAAFGAADLASTFFGSDFLESRFFASDFWASFFVAGVFVSACLAVGLVSGLEGAPDAFAAGLPEDFGAVLSAGVGAAFCAEAGIANAMAAANIEPKPKRAAPRNRRGRLKRSLGRGAFKCDP